MKRRLTGTAQLALLAIAFVADASTAPIAPPAHGRRAAGNLERYAAHTLESPLEVSLRVIGDPRPGDDLHLQASVISHTIPLGEVSIEATLSENLRMKQGEALITGEVTNEHPLSASYTLELHGYGQHTLSIHAQTQLNRNGTVVIGDTASLRIENRAQDVVVYDALDMNSGGYPCGADLSCGESPRLVQGSAPLRPHVGAPSFPAAPQTQADTLTISGVVEYEDNHGAIHRLRRARVELFDRRLGWSKDYDHQLASTYTDSTGHYAFTVTNMDSDGTGLDPYVRVTATDDKRVLVRHVWSLGNPRYRVDSDLIAEDITPGAYLFDALISEDTPAEPFHIFDTIANLGYEELARHGWANADLLSVYWPSLCEGIPYTGSCYTGEVYLDYDDGWDKDVILHEYGHFVLSRTYGNNAVVFACRSVGFTHYYGTHTSDSCAWSEGWANYLQAAIQNEGNYEDYDELGNPKLVYNIETDSVADLAPLDGDHPDSSDDELAVTGILWDINDNNVAPEAFDLVARGFDGPGGNGIWTLSTQHAMGSIIDFWEAWRDSGHPDLCEVNQLYTEHQIPFPPRTLNVSADPGAGGSVSVSPVSNCTGGTYAHGTTVTLAQSASPGYRFVRWHIAPGGGTDPSPTLERYMDRSFDILAEFEPIPTPTPTATPPPTPTPPAPIIQLYPGYDFIPDPGNFAGFPTVQKNAGVTWGYFNTEFTLAAGSPDSNYAEFTVYVFCERYSQPLDCRTAGVWLEFGTTGGGTPPIRIQNLSVCTLQSGTNSDGTWTCRPTGGDRQWSSGKPFIKLGMGCGGCTVGYTTLERLEIGNWPYEALPTPTPTKTPPPTATPSPAPCECALVCLGGTASLRQARMAHASKSRGLLANVRQALDILDLLRAVRDEIMVHTAEGQHLADLYVENSPEIAAALIADPELKAEGLQAIDLFLPGFEAMLEGRGGQVVITQGQIDAVLQFLAHLESVAGSELQAVIASERAALELTALAGMNFDQAQGHLLGNLPPEAKVDGPFEVVEGSDINLSGSGADPEGDALSFHWDFSGSGSFMDLGPDPVFSRPYLDGPLTVPVFLKVCDDRGGCDLDQTAVTVDNATPVVKLQVVGISPEGGAVFFYGEFSDPGALDVHTVHWDFGDGATDDGSLAPVHQYGHRGTYLVSLTVSDDDGGVGSAQVEILVKDEPPVLDAPVGASLSEGDMLSEKVKFSDPDSSSWVAFIDYGDGSSPDAVELAGELAIPMEHRYLDDGSFTVDYCVEDPVGETDCGSLAVTVANLAPLVEAGAAQSVALATEVAFEGSFYDPGVLDTHTITWDFGDGSTAAGSLTPTHTYAAAGKYTATLTVADNAGGVGADTVEVEVLNQPPVCSTGRPSEELLWPADHKFVAIRVVGVTDPEGNSLSISIDGIFQDEALDAPGSGSTAPDGQGVGTSTAEVRAERVGTGNGRFYHITFTADDGHGGVCSGVVLVGVPKSQSAEGTPVDDGPLYDSTVTPH